MTPVLCESFNNNNNTTHKMAEYPEYPDYQKPGIGHYHDQHQGDPLYPYSEVRPPCLMFTSFIVVCLSLH
jgi:hypothetical protein